MPTRRQFLAALGSSALASAIWVPSLSTVFGPAASTLAGDPDDPVIRGLLERQLRLWERPDPDVEQMRAVNPEWDFMGRTFTSLALLALLERAPHLRPRLLAAVDRIAERTLTTLQERGMHHFLLGYGRGRFVNPTGRSLFIDGELLTVLAKRESLVRDGRFAVQQAQLAHHVRANLEAGPLGHGESYPDECWAICNGFAAVGLLLDGRTSDRDPTEPLRRYRAGLAHLVEPQTGMLQSEYTYAGAPLDGPEGSSLYLSAALLRSIDAPLARVQYQLAQQHLLRRFLGFGYSREWRTGEAGVMDVDSGPIVPGFEASAGASGLALIGARVFGDDVALRSLLASLWATAFPTWHDGALSFAASNPVGDAAILWALVAGEGIA